MNKKTFFAVAVIFVVGYTIFDIQYLESFGKNNSHSANIE